MDYLSCVSGGGYTGTAYLDWKYHEKKKDVTREGEGKGNEKRKMTREKARAREAGTRRSLTT